MDQVFNNREIASAIWLLVFLAILLIRSSQVRAASLNLIKTFLSRFFLILFFSMLVYIALMVWGLSTTGFWDASAIKLTVLWVFGSALVMLFLANEAQKREGFFRKAILRNLTLIAVLEFVSNAYTFSLWIELLLVPVVAFIALPKALTEVKVKTDSSYKLVDKWLGYALALIGIVLLGIAIYRALYDIEGLLTLHNLRDFLLPVVLSILYLPFIYAWALFLAYDYLFLRINLYNKDRELARYLKKLVFLTFHVRLWRLIQWSKRTPFLRINNREDAKMLVSK
jgi:hypothetical protein